MFNYSIVTLAKLKLFKRIFDKLKKKFNPNDSGLKDSSNSVENRMPDDIKSDSLSIKKPLSKIAKAANERPINYVALTKRTRARRIAAQADLS